MYQSAVYDDFMGKRKPKPCPDQNKPHPCFYCKDAEYGECWSEHCPTPDAPDAPQHWTDGYVCGDGYDGHWHQECWDNSRPDEAPEYWAEGYTSAAEIQERSWQQKYGA